MQIFDVARKICKATQVFDVMEQGIPGYYSYPQRARQIFKRRQIEGPAPDRRTEPQKASMLYFACSSFMQNKACMLVSALLN